MEQRVKERLTGAVLLVGVVVLLVPELFRGERGSSAKITHPADPAAPPVQSYTIDLGAVPPAVADVQTLPPAPPIPSQTVTLAAPVAVEKPSVTVDVAAPLPKPRTIEPVVAAHGWVVQVGSFGKQENAARMAQQAAKKGVKLIIAGPDDHGLYRVRSPVSVTRAVAVQLQSELQAQGYKGIITSSP